jgi:hypothetical protein
MHLPNERTLIEVPLSVVNFMGKAIPACGGGYLRHLPFFITRNALLSIQKVRPAIVYLHPYELDTYRYPDYFYKAKASLKLKERVILSFYRINKGTVKKKLDNLLKEFSFKPIIEIIQEVEKKSKLEDYYI